MTKPKSSEYLRGKCPNCRETIRIRKSKVGQVVDCPGCSRPIRIAVRTPSKPPDPPEATDLPAEDVVPPRPVVPETPEVMANVAKEAGPLVVQVKKRTTWPVKSLGVVSLILGVLSACVLWMPFVGFVLSGLGMLLGTAALATATSRKSTGVGYATMGTLISATGIVLGLVIVFEPRLIDVGIQTVADYLDRAPHAEPVQAAPLEDAQHSDRGSAAGQDESAVDHARPDQSKMPEFHAASKPRQLGVVQLELSEFRLGKVPLYNEIFKEDSWSEVELLTIRIKITNTSATKNIDYAGWMSEAASQRGIDAELADDNEHRYRAVSFGTAKSVKNETTNLLLRPGKSISDAVVFELPMDGVKYLDLTLSAKGCDGRGAFRFRIPIEVLKR
ncbi:MAG: DUF308 domain-containing protein [Planctomycetaceae bacterium]